MITYVSDAVAFLHYLLDELPPDADKVFRKAERGAAILYLPTIAAAELYYLFERKNWMKQWVKLRTEMIRHTYFRYHSFNEDVLNLFEESKAKDIHDKIMVSTAKLVKAQALVTKDKELRKLDEVNVMW